MNLTQAADATVSREIRAVQARREKGTRELRATVEEPQGGHPDALAYIQSYHKIRAFVGFAGWILPFVLVIGWWLVERKWNPQTSLSAYYHTGMGDFFVTVLVVVGVLLVTYRLSDEAPDNRLGTWAGAAAFGVAFFPTARNLARQPDADLSAIQSLLTERWAQVIHFISAVVFIVLLARICVFFSELELAKERNGVTAENQKLAPAKWSHVHRLMAYIVAGALVFVAVFLALTYAHNESIIEIGKGNSVVEFLKEYCVLLGEATAVVAFGVSWFIKGLDRSILRANSPKRNQQEANSDEELQAEVALG